MSEWQPAAAVDNLERVKFFRGISAADSAVVLATMRRRQVRSGERVFAQGQTGDTMLVVMDGILRVEVTDMHGHTATVGKVDAGEVVGEMAVIDPAPRSASVVAATDCVLYELSRTDLMTLRVRAPSASAVIVSGIIGDVTRRLRNVNKRIDQELDPVGTAAKAANLRATGGVAPQADEGGGGLISKLLGRFRRG